jgi:hypothetical protein
MPRRGAMSGVGKKVAKASTYIKGKLGRMLGGRMGSRSMQAKDYGNQARGGAKYGIGKAHDRVDDPHEPYSRR